jgi:putative FmdB family regulatory protein
MPLYDYAPKSGRCKRCNGRFEVVQRVAEPKLRRCPACAKPVERLIGKVALGGKYSVSDSKVKSLGLTKYKKAGDGVYERTAGSGGPEVINRSNGAQKTDFNHPIRTVSDPWTD